jgi:hypothetical protein
MRAMRFENIAFEFRPPELGTIWGSNGRLWWINRLLPIGFPNDFAKTV